MNASLRVAEYLKTCDIGRVRCRDVAVALAKSTASLHRALQREGVNYATLLDAEKKRRCLDLLSINPRPDNALLAKKTGFINPTNAGRWFKSRMGITLREYKRARA